MEFVGYKNKDNVICLNKQQTKDAGANLIFLCNFHG